MNNFTFKNNRPANHGDSIVTPFGTAGTLQLAQMSIAGEPTPKILISNGGAGNPQSQAVQVGECYHAQDAYAAMEEIAAARASIAKLQSENSELARAVEALTPKS